MAMTEGNSMRSTAANRGLRRGSLLAGTALAGGLFVAAMAPTSALAVCTPTAGTNTYTCTGPDPTGVFITNVPNPTLPVIVTANGESLTDGALTLNGNAAPGAGVDVTYQETGAPSLIANVTPPFTALYAVTSDTGNINITTIAGSQVSATGNSASGIFAGILAPNVNPSSTGNIVAVLGGDILATGANTEPGGPGI